MIEIKIGDCTDRLKDLEDSSVDSIICDPPYGLKFMGKEWDDIGDISQQREWHRAWLTEAHRVLKKSGVLKAFSGSRTFHHLIAMMEEIGFSELRVEAWTYGSGFPKSHNVSKSIDKYLGKYEERESIGSYIARGYSESSPTKDGRNQWSAGVVRDKVAMITAPATEEAQTWEGWGTALKPSWEPVCVGVKK